MRAAARLFRVAICRRVCPLLLLALATSLAGRSNARPAKLFEHVVAPGESCWSIALRRYGKGERYDLIHRENDLGPMPHILKPGQRLQLPVTGELADAEIAWVNRDVKTMPPSDKDWRAAHKEMSLWKNYKVATGSASSASVAFEDRSELRMREDALLMIYGGAASKNRVRSRTPPSVMLERGVIRGGLASLDQQARMDVRTPMSEIRLASRSTQIEVDGEQTRVFVYDGKATVSARGTKVEVKADQGTVVSKGQKPAPPRPLPKAVEWAAADSPLLIIGPGRLGRYGLKWRPVPSAKHYRVEVARNERFESPQVDQTIPATAASYAIEQLKPGTYYARVAAIDEQRMEGRHSRAVAVRVIALATSRGLRPGPDGIDEGAGFVKVALPADQRGKFEVALDSNPMQAADAVRLHRPGVHVLRFRETASKAEGTFRVRILRVEALMSSRQQTVIYGSATPTPVVLDLKDERDRPVVLPGLYVDAIPGRTLPLRSSGRGQYTALLAIDWPMMAGQHLLRVVAGWAGGELSTIGLRVLVTDDALAKHGKAAQLAAGGRDARPGAKGQAGQAGRSGQAGSAGQAGQAAASSAFLSQARTAREATPEFIDQVVASDPDADGDGIPVPQDKCPKDAEDVDGFRDDDGCPDPDNDQDGIPDVADKCPDLPETINGIDDDDGCPDKGGAAQVVVSATQLELGDRIFFEAGSDRLKPKSFAILKQVASALKAHYTVRLVDVEGHTDDRGDSEMNVDLSERRAQRVVDFIVAQGVASHRLHAIGYGPKQPIAPNDTKEGRSKNRRVAFRVLKVVQVSK